MGNAGLGTTIPISSWVQNCNSHQSLRSRVLLVTERRSLWLLHLHSLPVSGEVTELIQGFLAKLGQLGGRCPSQALGPRETGPEGAALGGEQSWEGRLLEEAFRPLLYASSWRERVQPHRGNKISAKQGWALGAS